MFLLTLKIFCLRGVRTIVLPDVCHQNKSKLFTQMCAFWGWCRHFICFNEPWRLWKDCFHLRIKLISRWRWLCSKRRRLTSPRGLKKQKLTRNVKLKYEGFYNSWATPTFSHFLVTRVFWKVIRYKASLKLLLISIAL